MTTAEAQNEVSQMDWKSFIVGLAGVAQQTRAAKYQQMLDAQRLQLEMRQTATTDQNVNANTGGTGTNLHDNLLLGFSQAQVLVMLGLSLVGLLAYKAIKG